VAELLVNFTEPTRSKTGDLYYGQALGRVAPDGLWEAWIEFVRAGDDEVVRTSRETEQPSRDHVRYWAQGLTQTYLEGALERALNPVPAALPAAEPRRFVESTPRPPLRSVLGRSPTVVLDPFQVYAEGEELLRKQLLALSRDHVQNIVEAYHFSDADPEWVRIASHASLAQRVVDQVRKRFQSTEHGTEPAAEVGPQTSTEAHPPS
jgi:hypothetical protein